MGGELIDELEPVLLGLHDLGVRVTQQVPCVLMRNRGLESTEVCQRALVKTKTQLRRTFEKARTTDFRAR